MAEISTSFGCSHGPLLSTPPEQWDARASADRRNKELWFEGRSWSFDELVAERNGVEAFAAEVDLDVRRARARACQAAIASLGDLLEGDAAPDILVVVTDDQREVFTEELQPVFALYQGSEVPHLPVDEEEMEAISPGLGLAVKGHTPEQETSYRCVPELASHLVEGLMQDGFDIASSERLPDGRHGRSVGHGFGFIYKSVLKRPIPFVPVFVNSFYPPNQPTAARCVAFGQALARAVRSWDDDRTVGFVASGGLSHFVIEEEFDRPFLDAVQREDLEYLSAIPNNRLQSGTSEVRNWITVAGALAGSGLKAEVVDYVPCYRSEAGTGSGMGFMTWR